MVPPVGGILIGIGIFSISGSWQWALLGIPSDFGMLFLVLGIPWSLRELYLVSPFALVSELHAWRDGHRIILRLYKNSRIQIIYSSGPTQYHLNGNWSTLDDGYQIFDYLDDRKCKLTFNEQQLESTESVSDENMDTGLNLNELIFIPSQRQSNSSTNTKPGQAGDPGINNHLPPPD